MSAKFYFPNLHKLKKGQVLFKEGSYSDAAFIIESGKVEISVKNGEGKKTVIGVLKDNDIVGEMGLIDGNPRSATVTALSDVKIKEITSTPIIDVIDPAVKKACSLTKNNQVGIIGTEATINSNAYQNYIVKFNSSIQVIAQHCPLLVPIIEEGLHNHKIGINAIHLYLNTFNKKNIDTLILGCTHYPIMKETIKNYLNKNITIINSATETALAVQKFIQDNNLNNMGKFKQNDQYYVSDKTIRFHNLANQWKLPLK